ncbi:MAG: hypothetical protein PHO57_05410 [Acidithiobacillus sp.]|nr:hypothetical protein [Acidithiobacillus sp.]
MTNDPHAKELLTWLEAATRFMEKMEEMKSDPVISQSAHMVAFVDRLTREIANQSLPWDVLASHKAPEIAKKAVKVSATHAIKSRHAPAGELRGKVLAEADSLRQKNPKISKNQIAAKLAPLAMQWAVELGANLASMEATDRAREQIRAWLKPSRQK